MNPFFCLINKS